MHNRTPRETIQTALSSIRSSSSTLVEKVADVARAIGDDDRITTRMIRRQIITAGRA